MDAASPLSVALIDDQPVFVEGFAALCKRSGIRLLGTVTSASAAAAMIRECSPDIVFIDVASPDNPPECVAKFAGLAPGVKIVALTAARSITLAIRTLDAGAFGYVLKQSSGEEMRSAMHAIARGEKYITHGFSSKIITALQNSAVRKKAAQAISLSVRENQIVRLLVNGKTNKEIAAQLHISEKTVKHYMTLLMQKLNVRNRLEAAIAAQHLTSPSVEAVH